MLIPPGEVERIVRECYPCDCGNCLTEYGGHYDWCRINYDSAGAAVARAILTAATAASAAATTAVELAAQKVAEMYQADPLLTVDGLTDTEFIERISTLRAALKERGLVCRECGGTGQGEPSFDGEKYSPRDCPRCADVE